MRVLVVEDQARFAVRLRREIERSGAAASTYATHEQFLERAPQMVAGVDLVLVDVLEIGRNQGLGPGQRVRSLLVGLEVADELDELSPRVPAIAYSTSMRYPAVTVPIAEADVYRARYQLDRLVDDLPAALSGDHRSAEPAPDGEDRAVLGVGPHARLRTAVRKAEAREDVWAWICDVTGQQQRHSSATRQWICRALLPELDVDVPYAAYAIDVLRAVTGLAHDPVLKLAWS